MTVTSKPKCYVFVCAGCGLLASSERSDAITCSNACRVKAYRSGETKRLRVLAEINGDIHPALILQMKAVRLLAPDLFAELSVGQRREIDNEVRRLVWAKFFGGVELEIVVSS